MNGMDKMKQKLKEYIDFDKQLKEKKNKCILSKLCISISYHKFLNKFLSINMLCKHI